MLEMMTESVGLTYKNPHNIPSEDIAKWISLICEESMKESTKNIQMATMYVTSQCLELITYVTTGKRHCMKNPYNEYNLKGALVLYALAPAKIKEVIDPIVSGWKESVYGTAV